MIKGQRQAVHASTERSSRRAKAGRGVAPLVACSKVWKATAGWRRGTDDAICSRHLALFWARGRYLRLYPSSLTGLRNDTCTAQVSGSRAQVLALYLPVYPLPGGRSDLSSPARNGNYVPDATREVVGGLGPARSGGSCWCAGLAAGER